MATFTTDDLTTPLSSDDARGAIYDILAKLGVSTTNWKPGAVVRTIIAALAIVIAALSQLTAKIARSGFLDLSDGDWLTLVARYVYNVARIEATFATGTVVANNASGGIYVLAIGQFVAKNSASGQTYFNTASVTIGALATNVSIPVQAFAAGAAGTSFAGEIDTFSGGTLTGVTFANPDAVIGTDAEEDEALRIRCRAKLGALSPNGPADAYDFIAKSAVRADGTTIGVTRTRAHKDGVGGIDLYVADASGSLTGPDLAFVDEALQTQVVPLAVTLRTHAATAVSVPVTYEIWLYNTLALTQQQISDAVAAELAAFFEARPIEGDQISGPPGKLYVSGVEATIGRARNAQGVSLGIFRVDVTSPTSDITLGTGICPVLGPITVTGVHQVAP